MSAWSFESHGINKKKKASGADCCVVTHNDMEDVQSGFIVLGLALLMMIQIRGEGLE